MNSFRVGWSIAIGVFILIFVAACLFFYSKLSALETALQGQQPQIQALDEKLAAKAKIDLLDMQEKCSAQGERTFKSLGFKQDELVQFTSHYDPVLNKCFMFVETSEAKTGTIWNAKTLVDAFERKEYGYCLWHTVKGKKYWEVPPYYCWVTLPSGEKKICTSSDEFDSLVRIYMESKKQ